MPSITGAAVSAVILAGGRATRMGGCDKALVEIAGRTMLDWIVASVRTQVKHVVINANRNLEHYRSLGFTVIEDEEDDYQGPLAGMASAMRVVESDWIVTVPCDSPLLPNNLVSRFCTVLDDASPRVVTAMDAKRLQPVFNLMHVSYRDSIRAFLAQGDRKIDRWFSTVRHDTVDFSDLPDTFLNVNTPKERDALEQRLERAAT